MGAAEDGGRAGACLGGDIVLTGDYPVLAEYRLAPVSARFPRRARRDPAELPALEPGTVYVFEVDGEYRQPAVRRHLRGHEPDVVRAVAVSLIDMRPQLIPVEVVIASGSAGYDFQVLATFRCRVIDAPAAAAGGLRGVGELLAEHLGSDRELLRIGTDYDVDEIPQARTRIHTQVRAYCMVAPPQLPGLEVVLATVEVSPIVLEVVDDNYLSYYDADTTAADDTGLDDTGSDDTGLDDTGLDDTGRDDTGRDGTAEDDVSADDLVVVDVDALNEPCIDLVETAPTFTARTASAAVTDDAGIDDKVYDADDEIYDADDEIYDDRGAGRGRDEGELVGGSADR
jgi:hypothetical protein